MGVTQARPANLLWVLLAVGLALAPRAHAGGDFQFPALPFPSELPLRGLAPSDEPDQALLNKVDALLEAERLDEAAPLIERELAKAKAAHGPNHPRVASWLLRLAYLKLQQGKWAEADELYRQCQAIREKAFGPNSGEVGEVLVQRASLAMLQKRYDEAEQHLNRALPIFERILGSDDPSTNVVREMLALNYGFQQRYDEAISVYKQVLAAHERAEGPEGERTILALIAMARLYILATRFDEAEVVARRAFVVRERKFGPSHVETAEPMGLLSTALLGQGRYLEAEPLLARTIAILEKAIWSGTHAELAHYLGKQTILHRELGRYALAEASGKRAIELWERLAGPDHVLTAIAVGDLALVYWQMGRFAQATSMLERIRSLFEKDQSRPDLTGSAYNNLANLYSELGRFAEAENLYVRALALLEKRYGLAHHDTTSTQQNLALFYATQGRYAEAEPLFISAVAASERARPNHPGTAITLVNYSIFLDGLSRTAEADALRARALAIFEKAVGAGHPAMATTLLHIADSLYEQDRFAETETIGRRALAIFESTLGPDHADVAKAHESIAYGLMGQKRLAEAERAARRALAITEGALGPDHYDVTPRLVQLAEITWRQKRPAEAATLLRRAVAIYRKTVSSAHPALREALVGLSKILLAQGRTAEAVAEARAAVAVQRARAGESAAARVKGRRLEELGAAPANTQLLHALHALARTRRDTSMPLLAEAFEAAQFAEIDETAEAMAHMASRFATGQSMLAGLLREQHQLVTRLPVLERLLTNALTASDAVARAQAETFRVELAALEARLKEIDATLRRDHSAYADLVDPRALSLAEAQALLGPAEALVVHIVSEDGTYAFALNKGAAAWARSNLASDDLDQTISTLRSQLDPDQWLSSMVPFDRASAHRLYRELWQPLEAVVADKAQVFTVSTGALTSLPFSVMVTQPPAGGSAADIDAQVLRDTAWLAKRHALVTLPSVTSLKALRRYARKGGASEPFAGFGDPALGGADGARGTRSVASVFRGPSPNPDALRTLSPLPAAAGELTALAAALGATPADVYLRERATEARLKSLDLSRKRVLAFATHALMAGDMGSGEPGLVFTPPAAAGERDDGYLAASEAALLDLRADWVILSACNTAAGKTPGAKGLSGLARAFFLAGARSLLVSHWSVWDDAAGRITTATIKAYQADRGRGRAEALRQAALAVMQDASSPRFAHPAAWAPFVLVGEP